MTETTSADMPIHRSIWLGTLVYTFRALTGAHALSVYGFLALREILGAESSVMGLLDEQTHLMVIPSLFLLPVAALMRRKELVALLAPIALLCLIWYVPRFVGDTAITPGANTTRLSVMTYNVYAGNTDYAAMAQVIRESGADVVGLQELIPDAAAYLQDALADVYPESAYQLGKGFFSRYPITDTEFWRIVGGQMRAELDVNGQQVIVYNLHLATLGQPDGVLRRRRDAESVFERLDNENDDVPLIMFGDFNMGDRTLLYGEFSDRLDDSFIEVGQGTGFTYSLFTLLRVARLDYVFHNDAALVLEIEILDDRGGSDHHPLRAVFAFEN